MPGSNIDATAKVFARQASADGSGFGERVDIEQQTASTGTGSDTIAWAAVVSDWPCRYKPSGSAGGAREGFGEPAPSITYSFFGPAVTLSGDTATAITVKKEYRLKLKARGAEPVRYFAISDVSIFAGVELRISATLND